ncbi:MAG TPA: hypothetical protein ENK19_05530, partial [Acidobacteria bacterium]|nr:hypothetical protein [Acidobacteriota bacterium]
MIGTRHAMRMAVTILGAGAVCLALSSQLFALDPEVLPSQYRHEAWKIEDGLPQSSVMALARDRMGYLWVGTQAGLARFDGASFTVFDDLSEPVLPSSTVLSLLATGDGLLIGTASGLFRMGGGSIDRIALPGASVQENVRSLVQRSGGTVLVGTASGRMYELHGSQVIHMVTVPLAADRPALHTFLEWPDREIWIGTDQGLWRLAGDGAEPLSWTGAEGGTLAV